MIKPDWIESKAPSDVKTFVSSFEDEMFYVIKNRENEYILLWADAYDLNTGKTEFPLTKEQIETRFKITL